MNEIILIILKRLYKILDTMEKNNGQLIANQAAEITQLKLQVEALKEQLEESLKSQAEVIEEQLEKLKMHWKN